MVNICRCRLVRVDDCYANEFLRTYKQWVTFACGDSFALRGAFTFRSDVIMNRRR
ncbi:hypothetical protein T492DRAFT_1105583 [Pavlovales sp. CCMP2436]|nr:hypothetical protein T492DRAFT_1105583 [Pavlovales sp. CCMP2436]